MRDGGKGVRSPEGVEILSGVRRVCADLPGVVEAVDSFGHTSFRVRDKPFVMIGEVDSGASLAVKVGAGAQAELVARGDFYVTPYIGRHGWASIAADMIEDRDEIARLVTRAYRGVAPGTRR